MSTGVGRVSQILALDCFAVVTATKTCSKSTCFVRLVLV